MAGLEDLLREHATYSPDHLRAAPIREILADHPLDMLSAGMQARVFRVRGQPWVMKEGRWDLELQLSSKVSVPLYAEMTEKMLSAFSFKFLPRKQEISKQYREYLRIIRYLGFFQRDDGSYAYHHPEISRIVSGQRALRDSLLLHQEDLETAYDLEFPEELAEILSSPLRYRNFLPKEYLLVGESISPENAGKQTFFIFQEYVEGRRLHDVAVDDLSPEVRREMALFMYLLLIMRRKAGLIPDTRPRYPVAQAYDWLTKTDNIIVTESGMTFIDTRWFWESDAALIKRGLIIPELTLYQTKNTLSSLLRGLKFGDVRR